MGITCAPPETQKIFLPPPGKISAGAHGEIKVFLYPTHVENSTHMGIYSSQPTPVTVFLMARLQTISNNNLLRRYKRVTTL